MADGEIRRGLSEGLQSDVLEAVSNLKSYFAFYHHERLHQALGYQTPAAIYFGKVKE
jgi:transposase InsO family protein